MWSWLFLSSSITLVGTDAWYASLHIYNLLSCYDCLLVTKAMTFQFIINWIG